MAIASRLKWFLDVNRVQYDVLKGQPSDRGGPFFIGARAVRFDEG